MTERDRGHREEGQPTKASSTQGGLQAVVAAELKEVLKGEDEKPREALQASGCLTAGWIRVLGTYLQVCMAEPGGHTTPVCSSKYMKPGAATGGGEGAGERGTRAWGTMIVHTTVLCER